ncbi:transglycosylase domain-containing protein [Lacticaseibacillus sharpeae]|uniref:Membrane carboxypeptidase n=1 Tax=Lacticaseibacillus sharpeae JCM 1186 = DSM 20505 TaxID=1291052 RepID=A0A0R1ZHM2_9LACO|nr:transglycosylase domain-containing protein [Lacticaseibacillus sharpeae]KRM54333.1 membrane carboxypeptidase [Lacticaseibacillus sharpeae JCM 1186 = DSM 20505]
MNNFLHNLRRAFASGSGKHNSTNSKTNPNGVRPKLPPLTKDNWWLYVDTGIQVLRGIVIAGICGIILAGFLGLGVGLGYFASIIDNTPVPAKAAMRKSIKRADSAATLYYANDVKLGTVKSDLVRTTVKLDQVSPWLQKAVVATEDEDFFNHSGVMPKSLIRAVISSVTGIGSQTGGSTLTQQLVKMQLLSSETTFKRKAKEIVLAMRVDKFMSKQDILNAYLNVATFGRNNRGQNIAGVEEAAEGLFGTTAAKLNVEQAAFIAGLPQSPFGYTPYTQTGAFAKTLDVGIKRQKTVLFRMYRAGYLSKKEYAQAKAYNIKKDFLKQSSGSTIDTKSTDYAYNAVFSQAVTILAKQLAKQDGITGAKLDSKELTAYKTDAETLFKTKGYEIHSTLLSSVYKKMQEVMNEYKANFGVDHTYTVTDPNTGEIKTVTESPQNGMVLLDNDTGAILSFVGGTNGEVNHTTTSRSPGSAIKPILDYGPGIEQKVIGSNSVIADFPLTKFGDYKPTDFGDTVQNKFVPATTALSKSYNITALNLYNVVRQRMNVQDYMKKIGITTLTNNDYAQIGLGIGGTDYGVTVNQLTSAFATYANGGVHASTYMIDKITDPSGKVVYQHKQKRTRVVSKATSYIMKHMMNAVVDSGTAASLNSYLSFSTKNLMGKTGESNNERDSWFIGSTPGVSLGAWMGYDNNYRHSFNLASSATRTEIHYWAQQMNAIYKLIPNRMRVNESMAKPATVKSVAVNSMTGMPNGSVSYNGSTIKTSGNTVTSMYNDWTPGSLTSQFGVGGTSADYKLFWDFMGGASNGYGTQTKGDQTLDDVLKTSDDTTDGDTTGTDGTQTSSSSSSASSGSSTSSSSSSVISSSSSSTAETAVSSSSTAQ